MHADDLELPTLVQEMLAQGRWPPPGSNYARGPAAVGELVEAIEPGWREIWLEPPPFHTRESEVLLWAHPRLEPCLKQFRNATEIDFSRAVIIGDFGPGSDSPI